MTDATAPKETAAQRVERIKREKAPWSIMDDIRRYAKDGFAAIPADDLAVRFRAWGLYTQGDGGGTRGEEMPFFMMRVRTPNGILASEMVRTIANLSDRYARSSIDITNRQNFQLHWLRIEDVPAVWQELECVGWGSMGSCGDNTRTVTGCPLAGVEANEVIDASPFALSVDRFLNGIERRIGYKLDSPAAEIPPNGSYRDHVGINAQQQKGLYYAGFSVGSGRITPEQLRRIAALADRFGDGTLRTTVMQNILVLNIPESSVPAFVVAAEDVGVPLGGSPFQRGTLSCTGREFCKLAITETQLLSIKLAHELEDRVPGFRENVKIQLLGLPNLYGQH